MFMNSIRQKSQDFPKTDIHECQLRTHPVLLPCQLPIQILKQKAGRFTTS
jgi:hypothetical protein